MENLILRTKDIVELCWKSFTQKVGNNLLEINKEASMQLHFAYLLKNTLDLAVQNSDEFIRVELETAIPVNGRHKECDIVLILTKGQTIRKLPIEMKCYKEYASSGGKRGAVDIFMKDIYVDIELLEAYSTLENYLPGIHLTMTDYRHLVHPMTKKGKSWSYDASHGKEIQNGIVLNTPIGGKEVNIRLHGSYKFDWKKTGRYYFLYLENMEVI